MKSGAWWLYAGAVLIWGSTWWVIKFQLGLVAPEASVIYRFALAAVLLLVFAAWRGLPLRFDLRAHGWFAVQGLFLFCINYICFYRAELTLPSGLVALICSAMAFINIFGMRWFFAEPIKARTLLGSSCGIAGIVLVFWPEVAAFGRAGFKLASGPWLALGLASLGTVSASAGNLVSVKQRRLQYPLLPSVAYAMAYGVVFSLCYAVLAGVEFTFDWRWPYVTALLYLALLGSIAAFLCYLRLIERAGAAKAAYVNIAVPILALVLSSLVEDFHWQGLTYVGVALSLLGNYWVMSARR